MHWSGIVATDRRAQADLTDVEAFINGLYGTDLHVKRIGTVKLADLATKFGNFLGDLPRLSVANDVQTQLVA
jgi:hypothetical protein